MNIDQEINKAITYHESGKLQEAKEIYNRILIADPNHPDCLHLLGVLMHETGDNVTSQTLIHKAININPENAIYYCSLGDVLADQGNIDEAIACYKKALLCEPDFAQAYFNMAKVFHEKKQFSDAISSYQKALVLDTTLYEAYYNMGNVHQVQYDHKKAIGCYQRAVRLKPHFAEAYNNMGVAYQEDKMFEEAVTSYHKALESNPNYVEAFYNLGKAHYDQCNFDLAIASCQRAVDLNPSYVQGYNIMGMAFHARGNYNEALLCYEKALRRNHDNAGAHFNRSLTLLLHGNLSEGWSEYEWRLKTERWKRIYRYDLKKPRWDGSPFEGKSLFVHSEQGLGDILQFVRYLPMVKALGGKVIFQTKKHLMGLFRKPCGVDKLIGLSTDEKSNVKFDIYISLLSLPALFETNIDSIPSDIPYLFSDPEKVKQWKNCFAPKGFKVGIVWAGTAMNPSRSCPLDRFMPIAKIPGICLYGLQTGLPAEQIAVEGIPKGMPIKNLGEQFEDFTDTAAVIENLDLLISIDTSVAHLGGAMGKPVWLLLPFVPDWRWLLKREDSPWYPTMRLFRQQTPGDWDTVIQRMAEELNIFLRNQDQTKIIMDIPKNLDIANKYYLDGQTQKAEGKYHKILQANPDHPDALHGLGLIAYQNGKYDIARQLITKAIAESPEVARYYYNLGLVFMALGQMKMAIDAFHEAVNIKPGYADAHYNLGLSFKAQGQYQAAIEHFKQAVHNDSNNADARYNLGNTYKVIQEYGFAIECYRHAIRIRPGFVEAYTNIGLSLREQGRVDEAIEYYDHAITLNPNFAEAHWNKSVALLLNGNHIEGWKEFEWRFQRGIRKNIYPYSFTIPHWNGTSFLKKRLFVHSEQGLGDTLQFIRYLPMIKARGGTLVFETTRPLLDLLEDFPGIDELVEMSPDRHQAEECDFYVPLLSIPFLLGTTLRTIPANIPYLFANSKKAAYWREQTAGRGFKVGIVWAGKRTYENDCNRSCGLHHFAVLTEIPGIQLYGLQKGEPALQVEGLPRRILVTNFNKEIKDFTDTAGIVENMDLVIAVDTSVAHLAGAMGKPVWVLLPFVPDWRWMLEREDSPWYPTMRLFRQKKPGDWEEVFRRIGEELGVLVGRKRSLQRDNY